MRVSDYRDLISAVSDCRANLVSAANQNEQRREAIRLRNAIATLKTAACPRATDADLDKAGRVIRIAETLLAGKQRQFDAADALLCRAAFGHEWR